MIKKKICVLGAFAVGKTSLVEQYVNSIFSDEYHTTIGVKTDQKDVEYKGQNVRLIIWDINGEDDFQKVRPSYLIGAEGFIIIADGTRKETLDTAFELRSLAENTVGAKPVFLIINKKDLKNEWEITNEELAELTTRYPNLLLTSAKTSENVDKVFTLLVEEIMKNQ